MQTSKEILKKINDFIDQLPYERKPQSLYDPVKYVLSIGGKRVRPVLMLLAYNMYKEDPERILMPACALETYHNYTLLHDDLMDNADVRRGVPTVHRKWDANTAILSGDSMLVLAYHRMLQCDADKQPEVMSLFTETALEIGEGQQYDMEFENRNDVTEAEYIEMIRLKTSVLLACALKIGAILAGASSEDADNLYKFGEQIGLAFQLQDDLLDVYGDPKVFGKAVGGDITCNKKTYMLINAFQRANETQRAELERWVTAKDFDRNEKVAAVTEIYNQIGIRQLCEEKINYYFEESKNYLAKVNVADERKQISLGENRHDACDHCELLQRRGAETLATYLGDWYAGHPAVTEHTYGKGKAIYQACRDTGSLSRAVLERIVAETGLRSNVAGKLPYGVTAHSRTDGKKTYLFVEIYLEQTAESFCLHAPMENLLTGEVTDSVTLPSYGFAIFRSV